MSYNADMTKEAKEVTLVIVLPEDVHGKLKAVAAKNGVAMRDMVEEWVATLPDPGFTLPAKNTRRRDKREDS
jgi:hypothetical protein